MEIYTYKTGEPVGISSAALAHIQESWKKLHLLLKEGDLEAAKGQMYYLLHSRDMYNYWRMKNPQNDKLPQIWSFVRNFNFSDKEPTAAVNIQSGEMLIGSSFFQQHMLELEDAMFVVTHERNHVVLNKLWASELELGSNRKNKSVAPSKLPGMIFNLFDDAYINVAARKMIFSNLPERYYVNDNATKLLSGDIVGFSNFLRTTMNFNIPGWWQYFHFLNPYGYGNTTPSLLELTGAMFLKYVGMYASSNILYDKLKLYEPLKTLGLEGSAVTYIQVSYVDWMRTAAEWFGALDDHRRSLIAGSYSTAMMIGGSSHQGINAAVAQAYETYQKKQSINLPIGKTVEEAKAELQQLYDLYRKKKELEEKKEALSEEDLEARLENDIQKMENHFPVSSETEKNTDLETDLEDLEDGDIEGTEDDDSDLHSETEEFDDEDDVTIEGADGPIHPWDESARAEARDTKLFDEEQLSEEELEQRLESTMRQMENIASEFGIDLKDYDGSRLDESISSDSSAGTGKVLTGPYGEILSSVAPKKEGIEYIPRNSFSSRYWYGNIDIKPDVNLAGERYAKVGYQIAGAKVHITEPDDFAVQLALSTLTSGEIDLPSEVYSNVFNKFNDAVTSNMVGTILSKRAQENMLETVSLFPPERLSRRDMFWVGTDNLPAMYKTEYSIQQNKIALYFDVSGSMTAYLPFIPYFAKRLAEYAGFVFQFSTNVVNVDPFEEYSFSGGGTDFDNVGLSILDHGFESVIVLSDGEGAISDNIMAALKKQVTELYYLKVGSGYYRQDRFADFTPLATKIYPLFTFIPSEKDLKEMGIPVDEYKHLLR